MFKEMNRKLKLIDNNNTESGICINPAEFEKKCRTCFTNYGNINLFLTKYQELFLNQIFLIFSLPEICAGDGLPEKICGACAKKLFEFFSFKQQVERLQPMLKIASEYLKNGKSTNIQNNSVIFQVDNEEIYNKNIVQNVEDLQDNTNLINSLNCDKKVTVIRMEDHLIDHNYEDKQISVDEIKTELDEVKDIDINFSNLEDDFVMSKSCDEVDPINEIKTEKESEENKSREITNSSTPEDIENYFLSFDYDKKEAKLVNKSKLSIKEPNRCRSRVGGKICKKKIVFNDRKQMESKPFERVSDHSTKVKMLKKYVKRKERRPCTVCNKEYRLDWLRDHMNLHTKEKPYVCDTCGIKFSYKSNLNYHRNVHLNSACLCEHCGKMFATKQKLHIHMNSIHLAIKRHICHHCGKGFYFKGRLLMHARIHTGERPHLCTICGETFTQYAHLSTHIKISHDTDRPFECYICKKVFAVKYQLNSHQKLHNKKNFVKCATCKQFCKKAIIDEHLKLHDSGNEHVCGLCNATFKAERTLKTHRRLGKCKKIIAPLICNVCNKSFKSSAVLRVHYRRHTGEKPYRCEECGKSFGQFAHLYCHKKLHTGEKTFECSYCDKKFVTNGNLKQHMMIHTNERPYKCDLCNKGFITASNLRKHRRVHEKMFS